MIDPKFTEQIVRWLDGEHQSKEKIEVGAKLLLSLNRDHSMFQRIMRRPERELKFLEYKLRRFLQLRQDGKTIRDVVRMDEEITPQIKDAVDAVPEQAEEVLPMTLADDNGTCIRKGIRPDHDKLPDNIKAIWQANAERWKKIKEVFETCKELTEPCDRYEYLKLLKDTWYKYKKEMARYDGFNLTDDTATEQAETDTVNALTPEQEKELKNADSYISKNILQLQQLVANEGTDEPEQQVIENLRQRVQQRVDVLVKYGRTLTDERREQLMMCGIVIDVPVGNEQEADAG